MVSPTSTGKDAQATQLAEINSTSGLVALWLHGFSPETVRSYEYDLRCFIGFMTGKKAQKVTLNDLDLRTVKLNDVQAYVDFSCIKSTAQLASIVNWQQLEVYLLWVLTVAI
jgi:hypothetical protein